MANRVLHQRLQQHWWHLCAPDIGRHLPFDTQPVSKASLFDPEV
jgi:hypothetical protein